MTTRQLALNPFSVPVCDPTLVPNFVTTRHLVLDPVFVPNSVIPTFVTIHQINFVTIRHLVLDPLYVPILPIVVPRSEPHFRFHGHSSSRSEPKFQFSDCFVTSL